MIYDCCLFMNENDLFEIRLNELDDHVDKFLVCESNTTFTGIPKNWNFDAERFAKWKDKIKYIRMYTTSTNAWGRESEQRNFIKNILLCDCNMKDTDLIIVADVDEIPKFPIAMSQSPECLELQFVIELQDCMSLKMKTYYYYFNNYLYENYWPMPKIMTWEFLKTRQPDTIRRQTFPVIESGWHFSFIGDEHKILEKLHAFSHQELLAMFTEQNIKDALEKKRDLFNRPDCKMCQVPLDDTFPKFIFNNKERFAKYIL